MTDSKIRHRSNKILIQGGDSDVVKQFPMWGKGAPLLLWAENGQVCWEDARTGGGFGTMTWYDAGLRVKALSEMVIKSSEDRRWANERRQLQEFVCAMEGVIRKAKEQQGPWTEQELRSADKKRRKKLGKMINPRKFDGVKFGDPLKSL